MELLDPRAGQFNGTSYYCQFDGPELVDFVSSSITPTFAIEPTNSATLDVTGSFTLTDVPGQTCTFPAYATYTPIVTRVGGTESFACSPLPLATTYTGITCDSVTWNQLSTGTYQLMFSDAGIYQTTLVANTFVITTPTTVTETDFISVTASTTLSPAPTTTETVTSTTSVDTISSTPPAEPSSTAFETVFSTTVVSVSTSTPAPLSTETVNEYTSTETSTISLSADPASTVTVSVKSCASSPSTVSSATASTSSSTASSTTSSTTSSAVAPAATCVNWAECVTPNGATYTLTCSALLVGDEISKSYQKDYDSCASECESSGDCTAFSWSANKKCGGGKCTLLSFVENSVPGAPKDVSGTRTNAISLPRRNLNTDLWTLKNEPVFMPRNELPARDVSHCTTCHPDYTYPPVPTSTTIVSVIVDTTTITPEASGVSTDVTLVGATTTEVEATQTSGVTTSTVTTDTTSFSTTTLEPTVTTFTASVISTAFTTITPSPVIASTVTITYCNY
ncbi:hypothetical protein SUNI508_08249 [Seiridium unicorne]|uniref:Apple domain-containing protein n=1 Tax=Seiridium unicorne TaxID=138068 RepID=A0ABR2UV05_9PEZI